MAVESTEFGGMHAVWSWVEANARIIAGVGVLAIVAGFGYAVYQMIEVRQEKAVQEALFPLAHKLNKIKEGFDQSKFQKFMPKDEKADQSKMASGDIVKDYGSALSDVEKFAHDHVGSIAGAQAALSAGEIYLSYKQPEHAVELGELVVGHLNNTTLMYQMGSVMLGNALATKGDCQAAITAWRKVLDSTVASFLQPDVSLRAGLCYEQLGQIDLAKEMYQRTSAGGERSAARTAKSFLRALEIKSAKRVEAGAGQG